MKDTKKVVAPDFILPRKAVLEFMKLYEKTCKKRLTYSQAITEGQNLLGLFFLLQSPRIRSTKDEDEKLYENTE